MIIKAEEDIIEGCRKKKRKAQKKLYRMFYRPMLGICMRYASSMAEAEDVVMEGFMNVFGKIQTYKSTGPFEAWMQRIFVNTAIDNFRKNKKLKNISYYDDASRINGAELNLPDNLTTELILNTVQKLPEGYRMVFNLYAIEGYSHKEIAEKLFISVNTSKTQLLKARKYLKRLLLELDENINS